ncbi:MAG: AraC family transcriptional regulator [Planctomycetota bacterium]
MASGDRPPSAWTDRLEIKPRHTPWPKIPELSVLRYIDKFDASPMRPHIHPGEMEINLMVRGHIAWWVAGQTLDVTGGEVHLTWPGEPHSGANNIFESMTLYGVILHLPTQPERLLQLPKAQSRALMEALTRLPRQFRAGPTLEAQFRKTYEASLAPQTIMSELALRVRLVALLVEVVESANAPDPFDRACPQVRQALNLMLQHLEEPLSLEEIATRVCWSLPHLKSRFRQETGTTPAREYLRLRVREAVNRLSRGGTSVTQIAHAMGFSSSQYLATCVRRVTGLPPSAFFDAVHRGTE